MHQRLSSADLMSVLVAGDKVAGLIAMREPCPDAEAGIQALKAAGIAPVMLTSDNGPVRAC
jgi:Cd2+/Zn2+-exporting ATPase